MFEITRSIVRRAIEQRRGVPGGVDGGQCLKDGIPGHAEAENSPRLYYEEEETGMVR